MEKDRIVQGSSLKVALTQMDYKWALRRKKLQGKKLQKSLLILQNFAPNPNPYPRQIPQQPSRVHKSTLKRVR